MESLYLASTLPKPVYSSVLLSAETTAEKEHFWQAWAKASVKLHSPLYQPGLFTHLTHSQILLKGCVCVVHSVANQWSKMHCADCVRSALSYLCKWFHSVRLWGHLLLVAKLPRLSPEWCLSTWLSWDISEPCSTLLLSGTERGWNSIVCHLLSGTHSCGVEVQQTDDLFLWWCQTCV